MVKFCYFCATLKKHKRWTNSDLTKNWGNSGSGKSSPLIIPTPLIRWCTATTAVMTTRATSVPSVHRRQAWGASVGVASIRVSWTFGDWGRARCSIPFGSCCGGLATSSVTILAASVRWVSRRWRCCSSLRCFIPWFIIGSSLRSWASMWSMKSHRSKKQLWVTYPIGWRPITVGLHWLWRCLPSYPRG